MAKPIDPSFACLALCVGALAAPAPAPGPASPGQKPQDPPQVVELSPPHLALDVDAKQVTQLIVTFDRPMQQGGWSLCGGGAQFPKIVGQTHWRNPRTLVAYVELEPEHDYHLSLNCPSATNFRSREGVPLSPAPWSFSTLPEKLPPQAAQRSRNRAALDELMQVLAERYSYYDLRVKSWTKLRRQHERALLAAQTDAVWAGAAAQMLAAAEDIHMHLRLGGRTFATGTRAVDPLFRRPLLEQHFYTRSIGDNAIAGRSEDGIGYLMVGSWSGTVDLDAVEKALGDLRDTKAMVVDARPNAGGDELMARRIAAWFVEGTRTYAKNRYRTGAGKDGFGEVLERQVTGNEDPERRYAGPIAVLTSPYVMSSNESFVMMLQQAEDCTLVGQPTFGSSGNPRPHELSNGVTLVLPSWQDLRLDGTCLEGEGLSPDVEVAVDPAELEGRDPILERALELLRARVQGGS